MLHPALSRITLRSSGLGAELRRGLLGVVVVKVYVALFVSTKRLGSMDAAERQFLDQTRAAFARGEVGINDFVEYSGITNTFMYHGAKFGWKRLMKWLLVHGADVNLSPAGEWKPLHHAAFLCQYNVTVMLLDAGALVNAVDQYDETALHLAARHGLYDMCKLLLSRGAALDMRNDDDEDPETSADNNCEEDVVELLAEIRAAGGWKAYVDAPRNEFLGLRRNLPALLERGRASVSQVPPHLERLFNPAGVPEDVFIHVFSYWRGKRDSSFIDLHG